MIRNTYWKRENFTTSDCDFSQTYFVKLSVLIIENATLKQGFIYQ